MMSFEFLPNEILLDLFDYFDSTELFYAFYALNFRFNLLIINQLRSYKFNFESVSKRYFTLICQEHLLFLADRILSLRFSGYHNVLNQLDLFYSYIPSFQPFIHLQFLSLSDIQSYQTLMKIINELPHFHQLIHLKMSGDIRRDTSSDFQLIVNNIWSLPKLIHCDYKLSIQGQKLFCIPTKISASLKCILITSGHLKWNQINRLFQCTPRLTRLLIYIDTFDHDHYSPFSYPALTDLKITAYHDFDVPKLFTFLQNSPNLSRLDIDLPCIVVDGYQWERIIRTYLPKLKVFRLTMRKTFDSDQKIDERVDELVDSFRGSFWIDEHRWFFRCYAQEKNICFASSCTSNLEFINQSYSSLKSTCPYSSDEQDFYNNIKYITSPTFFNQSIPSYFNLCNIMTLSVKLPLDHQLWSRISCLNELRVLMISSHIDTFQYQIQALLDRAPVLNALFIQQDVSLSLQRSLFQYTNASVRALYLQQNHPRFNEEECIALAYSPLGAQCETLSIRVNNRECIISLVTNMSNLQSLDVEYENDVYDQQLSTSGNWNGSISDKDQLVQWLKDHLPSTYCIARHRWYLKNILIWI